MLRRTPTSTLFPYTTLFRSSPEETGYYMVVVNLETEQIAVAEPRVYLIGGTVGGWDMEMPGADRKSTRLNSSHVAISYAVFCLKKKKIEQDGTATKSTRLKS